MPKKKKGKKESDTEPQLDGDLLPDGTPRGDTISQPLETPREPSYVLELSEYKKMSKALKSTKLDKCLEGCEAAMDPAFVLKSNAVQALMTLVAGNKKVMEAQYPALRAISNFVDPDQGYSAHFTTPGVKNSTYSKNGLVMINKKSSSWKGLEKIVTLLKTKDDTNVDVSFEGRFIDAAMKTIAGVLESMHGHVNDFTTGDGNIYRQKIADLNGLYDVLVNAMRHTAINESTKRYGIRALHRCSFTLGASVTRPSLELQTVAVATTEEEKEDGMGDTKSIESMVDIDLSTLDSETTLLTPFVSLLLKTLLESVEERSVPKRKTNMKTNVKLADVTCEISPELCLLHQMLTSTDNDNVIIECLLNNSIYVFGQVLSVMDAKLTVENEKNQHLLKSNINMASSCITILLNASCNKDILTKDTRLNSLHDVAKTSTTPVTSTAVNVDVEGDAEKKDGNGGEEDGDEDGKDGDQVVVNVVEVDYSFVTSADTCATALGGLLATLMSSAVNNNATQGSATTDGNAEKETPDATTIAVMRACYNVSTLISKYNYTEILRPSICQRGGLPFLRQALAIPCLSNDSEKVLHVLCVRQEGTLKGEADERVLGEGEGIQDAPITGKWMNVNKLILMYRRSLGTEAASTLPPMEGTDIEIDENADNADDEVNEEDNVAEGLPPSECTPNFILQSRLLRLLSVLTTNQNNAEEIGSKFNFLAQINDALIKRHWKAPPLISIQKQAIAEAKVQQELQLAEELEKIRLAEEAAASKSKKKKKKKKKEKKKKKIKVDPEAVVQKWIASCANASLNDLRTRGEYIGSEMSILSLRLLRNLICHHSKTCKKLGNEGLVIIPSIIQLLSSVEPALDETEKTISPDVITFVTDVTMYDPCLSRWTSDIIASAKTHALTQSKQLDIPIDNDLIETFLINTSASGVYKRNGANYEEGHPTVSTQGEAMVTLSCLAAADASWTSTVRERANAILELDDETTDTVEDRMLTLPEYQCGYAITEYVASKHSTLLLSICAREKNSAWGLTNSTDVRARDMLLRGSLDAVSGICRGTEGRTRLLNALDTTSEREEDDDSQATNQTNTKWTQDVSDSSFDKYRLLIKGVVNVIFAKKPTASEESEVSKESEASPVTLFQQFRAISCLFSLCKDNEVDSAKQSLSADITAQVAILNGCLVALISLLDLSFISKECKSVNSSHIHAFNTDSDVNELEFVARVQDLIAHLIGRGSSREEYYITPGEEDDGITEDVVVEEEKVVHGEEEEKGDEEEAKKGKKGNEEPELEEVGPGTDPNCGPTMETWSTVLNAQASFPQYFHKTKTAIHAAVTGQHAPVISALLSAGVNVNIADEDGITPLMSALGQGDDKVVKDLLYIGQSDVNAVDNWGNTVLKYSYVSPSGRNLMNALKEKKRNSTQRQSTMEVLMNRINTNTTTNNNQEEEEEAVTDALDYVVVEGNDRNLSQLLQGEADVTVCDADGNYPLHWLGRGVNIDFLYRGMNILLQNSIKSNEGEKEEESQTQITKGYHVSRCKTLLLKGAATCINGCNKFGQTPLHVALASGLTGLASVLLSNGANPNICDVHGNLPLHLICTGWSSNCLSILNQCLNSGSGKRIVQGTFSPDDVALGLNVSQRETERVEKILTTSFKKHVTAPPSILSKQVSLNELLVYPNQKGHGALHVACGSCANIEHDTKTGGPLGPHSLPILNTKDPSEDQQLVKNVISKRKKNRLSILHSLFMLNVEKGNSGTIQKVIDVNSRTMPFGLTPLHYAARASLHHTQSEDPHLDEATIDLLISHGADVNAVDAQTRAGGGGPRYSPLHYALKKSPELAWHLLRVDGANPHPATANPPALLIACEEGVDASMIGYLVTHGENPNITGSGVYQGHRKYCGTGLMLASEQGHDHIVAALVLNLTDVIDVNAIRPHNGRSALHLAAYRGHVDVVKHLIEDGSANKYLQDNNGETPLTSSIRGLRPDVLKILLLDIDDTMKADHALTENDSNESALLIAEMDNLAIFSKCQRAGISNCGTYHNASNENLEELDRSNQVVSVLLKLLTSEQNSKFEHRHECFGRGMNLAEWYDEQEGKN